MDANDSQLNSITAAPQDDAVLAAGARAIQWAQDHMPILASIKQRFLAEKPFRNLHIGICLHVEPKTGVWLDALVAGGARITITGSPGSTQDPIAAVLGSHASITVLGSRAETRAEHDAHCLSILRAKPDILADNGADLHMALATRDEFASLRTTIRGATEETTTGACRLREAAAASSSSSASGSGDDGGGLRLGFPTWVINDTQAKRIVENRYGVGSSVVDALMRATNLTLHGKRAVVVGHGFCGAGVAHRLRGLGAHVTVVEADPVRRLEAHLEGFRTAALDAAGDDDCLATAQLLITVTGRDGVVTLDTLRRLRDGCIVANAGHFSSEIDLAALKEAATAAAAANLSNPSVIRRREYIDEYRLGGKRLFVVADGNLVNLAAADGNAIEIMDLGLALQSLSLEQMALRGREMEPGVVPVSREIENMVASLAIEAWI